jgi:hypothetical protein
MKMKDDPLEHYLVDIKMTRSRKTAVMCGPAGG